MNAAISTAASTAVSMAPGVATSAAVGMTLAAIAYAPGAGAIGKLLADASLATQGRWTLAWYAMDAGSQIFVAQDTASGQYAITIRGSVTDPRSKAFWIDWFGEDLAVFRHVAWPYGGAPAGATIAQGSLRGLNSLLALKDGNGTSLTAFLRTTLRPAPPTVVIGHSLGGDLAGVLAAYLHQEFSPESAALDFWPLTFAGPSAGNAVFAGWLAQVLQASSGRYYNSLDVVPHAWAALPWIDQSFPGGPQVPVVLRPLFDALSDFINLIRADYTQPGDGIVLTGSVAGGEDWFAEAGAQHATDNYLKLLGAPALPA